MFSVERQAPMPEFGASASDGVTSQIKPPAVRAAFDWQAPVADADRERVFASVLAIVDKWRLHLPAILVLESVAPMGHLAGQTLVFLTPFLATLMPDGIYDVQRLVALIEDPNNLKLLTERIAEAEKNGPRKQ